MWCWQSFNWLACSFHCTFFVVIHSWTFVQHFKSFPTHPHTINLSLFLFLLHSRDITPKGQVIIALKQMRYDRCQAVVMSDGCLRAKVRPPAEETLVFMLESMKHTPTMNCSPPSALRWRAVHSGMTCAINGEILSDNRKLIRCSQVNPVKQMVIKGDTWCKKKKTHIKRGKRREKKSTVLHWSY